MEFSLEFTPPFLIPPQDNKTYCPTSGNPLKVKDLITVKFTPIADRDTKTATIVKQVRERGGRERKREGERGGGKWEREMGEGKREGERERVREREREGGGGEVRWGGER